MIFYKSKRLAFFLTSDIVLILLSVYLAFSLRFSGDIPSYFLSWYDGFCYYFACFKTFIFVCF